MNNSKYLFEYLNLTRDFLNDDVDVAYEKVENKTEMVQFSWKVLRDPIYCEVYRKYLSVSRVIDAGFFVDDIDLSMMEIYRLNFLTTPVGKILPHMKKHPKKPVVLLSTGGFAPIHDGHLKMMELSRKQLENDGYDVVGGYFSLSHESYVSKKPHYSSTLYERLAAAQNVVEESDWLMIDPFESVYMNGYINFTDVLRRLSGYLRRHVDPSIQVAYVFGGDNVSFMYCFEQSGIGVCVGRDGSDEVYQQVKKEITCSGCYFVDNFSTVSKCTSSSIRKQHDALKTTPKYDGVYMIRNESILPFLQYEGIDCEELVSQQNLSFRRFVDQLNQLFDYKIQIKTVDMVEQLNSFPSILKSRKTISLDSYYQGTYNVEVSRLFYVSDTQKKNISMVGRIGKDSIERQVSEILPGNYVLVDDDSVTGATIEKIKESLPEDVKIDEVYLLSNVLNDRIYDVVDFRDFLIGSRNGGLTVLLPNGEIARVPYVLPYVSLNNRASIEIGTEMEMSVFIWKMNLDFYCQLSIDVKLSQTEIGFWKLMKYLGFSDDTSLTEICLWHLKQLNYS